jgi:protein-disulfide isomerase
VGKQERYAARERRAAEAAAKRRVRKRNQIIASVGGLVIVGLIVAIVVSLVNATGGAKDATATGKPLVAPTTATAGGALVLGKATAPVRLEIFLDYMCPYCGRFERANAGELDRLVADGTVRIELYPLAFLDKMSNGSRYSTRAANAVATVADRAPEQVQALNQALFASQPAEGSDGLSDTEIARLAAQAGVPSDVVSQFTERKFEPWVVASTSAVFATGVTGTPTVRINGTRFSGDLYTAGPLTKAIEAAKGQ